MVARRPYEAGIGFSNHLKETKAARPLSKGSKTWMPVPSAATWNVQSSKMVRAALLRLMLEAVPCGT